MAVTPESCIAALEQAAGRPLSKQETNDLITELDRRIAAEQARNQLEDLDTIVRKAADDYAAEMAQAAIIEKRNAALQLKVHLEAMDKIGSQFASNPSLGVESVQVGVNTVGKGARNSAALAQDRLKNQYKSGLLTDLRRADVLDTFTSGTQDREIAKALWARNRAEPAPAGVSKEADKVAEIVAKYQELARTDANKAGAWIKKIEGYITRQSHDAFAIRRAGYDEWKDAILPKLDAARTFAGVESPEEFLKAVWTGLASGIHLRTPSEPSGFRGSRNLAKKASEERVLHFKGPDEWFDYNEQFGLKSMRESVMSSLDRMAQDTGLMQLLGPNPGVGFQRLTDALMAKIDDPAKRQKFQSDVSGYLTNRMRELDGTTRMPVSHVMAKVGGTVRAVTSMAKLGAAIASQFGDVAVYGSEMRYQGRGMLSGVAESLGAIAKGLKPAQRNDLYSMLGVYFEGMAGSSVDRFSLADQGLPGWVSKSQQLFFKLNLMRWWSDAQKASAVTSFSHNLALNAGNDFASLHPDLQRVLSLFGIGERQWKIMRNAVSDAEDGRLYLTPEKIEELPDDHFEEFLSADGIKPTPTRIATAKREIADQLRNYFVDRASFAQLTPDARTRSALSRSNRPGTIDGEFWRFVNQFRSFSVAMIQKTLGREIYGRGAAPDATLWKALRSGNGEMLGVANLIAYSVIFGYVAMSTKDLMKGKTPRNPTDYRTWVAALSQSGGLGIYGDFLFGEVNRNGGSFPATLLGPTLGGTASDLYDIFTTLRDQSTSHPEREAAAKLFRSLLNNTPYVNLFYTKPILDYLIVNRVQEFLSPGYLKRMQRRVEKDNKQQFLIRPSYLGAH